MKSMTGFGRAEATVEGDRLSVEISSVNRKQSDIVISIPREWSAWESEVRKLVAPQVSRGRVQVQVKLERVNGASNRLNVDEALAGEYLQVMDRLAMKFNLPREVSLQDLLRAQGVVTIGDKEAPAEDLWQLLENNLKQALQAFGQSREREGEHLLQDLEARLKIIEDVRIAIVALAPSVVTQYREALRKRLDEAGLPLPMEDERLLREIALYADRTDLSEELTRLQGHIDEFRRLMGSNEPQGRAMDFLTQELNRELNTLSSKANNTAIAHLVVSGKTELERIREQVQNIE